MLQGRWHDHRQRQHYQGFHSEKQPEVSTTEMHVQNHKDFQNTIWKHNNCLFESNIKELQLLIYKKYCDLFRLISEIKKGNPWCTMLPALRGLGRIVYHMQPSLCFLQRSCFHDLNPWPSGQKGATLPLLPRLALDWFLRYMRKIYMYHWQIIWWYKGDLRLY